MKIAHEMSQVDGYKNFAAGLCVGAASLASGWGMSIFVKHMNEGKCAPTSTQGPETAAATDETTPLVPPTTEGEGVYAKNAFVKTVLSLIWLEAIGLYGLIVALFLVY